jgi:hypothetical protein
MICSPFNRHAILKAASMADDRTSIVPAPPTEIPPANNTAIIQRARAINNSIDTLRRDAEKIQHVSRHELEEVAEKYSRSPSTFLAAVLGGAIGSAGGIALGTLGGGLLIVTGPIGLAMGAAIAVLTFRGRNYWRIEKATQKAKGAVDFVRAQIDALPSDAPQEVRERLYAQYTRLMDEYSRVAKASIDDDRSGRGLESGPSSNP